MIKNNNALLNEYKNAKGLRKQELLNELIVLNDGLIHHFCNKMKENMLCTCFDYNDMYQTAVLGLMDAIKQYDETKGALSTYAYYRMFAYVHTAYHSAVNTIRIPSQLTGKLRFYMEDLEAISLTKQDEEDDVFIEDIIKCDNLLAEESLCYGETLNDLYELCDRRLNDAEFFVVVRYYGLDGEDSESLPKIATRINRTTCTASTILKKALRKLRLGLYKRQDDFINAFTLFNRIPAALLSAEDSPFLHTHEKSKDRWKRISQDVLGIVEDEECA